MSWYLRQDLREIVGQVDATKLMVSIILGAILAVVQGFTLRFILAKYLPHVPTREVVAAFLLSQPARYVPGKIWSAVVQSGVLAGHSPIGLTAAANVELAFVVVVQLTSLGLVFYFWSAPWFAIGAAVTGVVASGALLMLPTGIWIRKRLPGFAQRLGIPADLGEGRQQVVPALGLATASMTFNAAGSWMVVLSMGPALPPGSLPSILAVFYLGYAASVVAFPVPAGVGVREAAVAGAGAMIAPGVPVAAIIAVAILVRCWQLLLDALTFVAGNVMLGFDRKR